MTTAVQAALLAIKATEARAQGLEEAALVAQHALEKLGEPTQALIVGDAIRALKGQSNDQG